MQSSATGDATLEEIIARLVETIHPEKIILFGSRALDAARSSSDFDLLIVQPSAEPHHRRLKPAYDALWGIRAPIDLLWYTPEEFEHLAQIPAHVAFTASRQGTILYERPAD